MGGVSIWPWIVVGIVVMLLFGRGKISELMGDVAKGIKSFKQGMSDDTAEAAKPAEPVKTIEAPAQTAQAPQAAPAAEPKAH